MTEKLSPLPWYIEEPWGGFSAIRSGVTGRLVFGLSCGDRGERYTYGDPQADAHYITTAVNSHRYLVETCQALIAWEDNDGSATNTGYAVCDAIREVEALRPIIAMARAALKKAGVL